MFLRKNEILKKNYLFVADSLEFVSTIELSQRITVNNAPFEYVEINTRSATKILDNLILHTLTGVTVTGKNACRF